MRTDDLITALAADTRAVPRYAALRGLALSTFIGAPIALALTLWWLGLRPDLVSAVGGAFFWIKAAYTLALSLAFGAAALRLVRPGARARAALATGGGVIVLIVLLGLVQLIGMEAAERMPALRGCSALGAPMTLVAILALRSMAPTSPTLAGGVVGLFCGGVSATVYGLHCPEATLAFVGLWYSLGVMACGALGVALGRWLLRW
ncbi:MAG: DUF1109 family protein [Caulobacterales bacterium]|nr:DUF1109 family protein [Caulobacterales bacterium]